MKASPALVCTVMKVNLLIYDQKTKAMVEKQERHFIEMLKTKCYNVITGKE